MQLYLYLTVIIKAITYSNHQSKNMIKKSIDLQFFTAVVVVRGKHSDRRVVPVVALSFFL